MKIGYTVQSSAENIEKLTTAGCKQIITQNIFLSQIDSFDLFVQKNLGNEMYVVNLDGIGNTVHSDDLFPIITYIVEKKGTLRFIDYDKKNSTDGHLCALYSLLNHNKQARHIEQKVAKRPHGRPTIKQEVISKIQYLYIYNNLTIREIAEICSVSVGTAHKYSKLAEKQHEKQHQIESEVGRF